MKKFMPSLLAAMFIQPCGALLGQDLSSVVEKVTARNPGLSGARARIEGAESEFREARSLRYPRFAVRSSYMRGDNPVYAFGSLLEQKKFGAQNFQIDSLNNPDYLTNIKNSFDLGVPLFAGFEAVSGEKIRKLGAAQAREQLGAAEQSVRLQALDGYLSVLFSRRVVEILDKRIESSAKEIEAARKLNARGVVLGSDFYAAQAILSALRARGAQTRKEAEAAEKRLAILMGEPPNLLTLSGSLASAIYPLEEEEILIARGLSARREAKEADLDVAMADAGAKQAKRSFLPRIEAFASVETNTEDFQSNPTNRTVGIRSHFPLGDPSYFPRKEKANAGARAARSRKEQVEESIRLEISEAIGRHDGARASLPLAQEAARQAEKSLELFLPLYREGRQSILDVLHAEEGLAQAEAALSENLYQIHSSYARILFSTGKLTLSAIREIQDRLEALP